MLLSKHLVHQRRQPWKRRTRKSANDILQLDNARTILSGPDGKCERRGDGLTLKRTKRAGKAKELVGLDIDDSRVFDEPDIGELFAETAARHRSHGKVGGVA